MDLVLIDAPCSGTGVWRRRRDAKWRLNPAQLMERTAEQSRLLFIQAAPRKAGRHARLRHLLTPAGGNEKQIEDFLESNPAFTALNLADRAARILSRPIKSICRQGSRDCF